MDQGGGENVIYVQVDEDGKVLNYTSQMAGGEQVILLQEGMDGQPQALPSAPGLLGVGDTGLQGSPILLDPTPAAAEMGGQTVATSQGLLDNSGLPVMVFGQPDTVASTIDPTAVDLLHTTPTSHMTSVPTSHMTSIPTSHMTSIPQLTTTSDNLISISSIGQTSPGASLLSSIGQTSPRISLISSIAQTSPGASLMSSVGQGTNVITIDQTSGSTGGEVLSTALSQSGIVFSSSDFTPSPSSHILSHTPSHTLTLAPVITRVRTTSGSSLITTSGDSGQMMDQSGVPVMVLGQATRIASGGGSNIITSTQQPQHKITSPQIVSIGQKKSGIVYKSPPTLMTKPIAGTPGRSLLISKVSPGGTKTLISQGGRSPSSGLLSNQPGGSLLIRKGPDGSIVIPKFTSPHAAHGSSIRVSRPVLKVSGNPGQVLLARPRPHTPPAGIIRLTKPVNPGIAKPQVSRVSVTQPVLRYFSGAEPKATVLSLPRPQAAEVSSTVNGTEPVIEITDDDEASSPERASKQKTEVIQDVHMSPVKPDYQRSEDEVTEDTTGDAGAKQPGAGEKEGMDTDLMAYLGGETAVTESDQNPEKSPEDEKQQEEEEHKLTEESEEEEHMDTTENQATKDDSAESPEESGAVATSPSQAADLASSTQQEEEEEEDLPPTPKGGASDNEDYEDDEDDDDDDDDEFPAGLLRGEPVNVRRESSRDPLDASLSLEGSLSKSSASEGKSTENGLEVEDAETQKKEVSGEKSEVAEAVSGDVTTTTTVRKSRAGRPRKPVNDGRGRPRKATTNVAPVQDPNYMFGFESIAGEDPANGSEGMDAGAEPGVVMDIATEAESPETKSPTRKRGRQSKKDKETASEDDPDKMNFMKTFDLVSPQEMEKLNRRNSKRVSHAAAKKESRVTPENHGKNQNTTPKMLKKKKFQEVLSPERKNVFEMFDLGNADLTTLQMRVRKLDMVNAELKTKLREAEHKALSSQASNARFHEMKGMQNKIQKLEKLNSELQLRLEDYEGKPSPPERTVDVSFKMGNLSFKTPVLGGGSPALTSPPSGAAVRRPAAREEELRAREDTARRKEKWIRDLDAELDRRTAQIKGRESKIQRIDVEFRAREQKLEYREAANKRKIQDIEYRERMLEGKTKAALEKMHKSSAKGARGTIDGESEDPIRDAEMKRFEQEQKNRELKQLAAALKEKEQEIEKRENALEQAKSTPVISQKTPQAKPAAVVPNKTPQAKSAPVISNKTPQAKSSPVVSQKTPQAKSSPVVSKKTPQAKSSPVVSKKTPQAISAPVVSQKTPQAKSTPGISKKTPQAKSAPQTPEVKSDVKKRGPKPQTPVEQETGLGRKSVGEKSTGVVKSRGRVSAIRGSTPQSETADGASETSATQKSRGRPKKLSVSTPTRDLTPVSDAGSAATRGKIGASGRKSGNFTTLDGASETSATPNSSGRPKKSVSTPTRDSTPVSDAGSASTRGKSGASGRKSGNFTTLDGASGTSATPKSRGRPKKLSISTPIRDSTPVSDAGSASTRGKSGASGRKSGNFTTPKRAIAGWKVATPKSGPSSTRKPKEPVSRRSVGSAVATKPGRKSDSKLTPRATPTNTRKRTHTTSPKTVGGKKPKT